MIVRLFSGKKNEASQNMVHILMRRVRKATSVPLPQKPINTHTHDAISTAATSGANFSNLFSHRRRLKNTIDFA